MSTRIISTRLVEVVAGLAVRDGRALLVQRHTSAVTAWSQRWGLAGGKREPNESLRLALEREWQEELTCQVHVGELLHACVHRVEGHPDPYRVSTFEVDLLTEPELTAAGGNAMRWVPLGDIEDLAILAGTSESIEAWQALHSQLREGT